jgi:hypothetical protein
LVKKFFFEQIAENIFLRFVRLKLIEVRFEESYARHNLVTASRSPEWRNEMMRQFDFQKFIIIRRKFLSFQLELDGYHGLVGRPADNPSASRFRFSELMFRATHQAIAAGIAEGHWGDRDAGVIPKASASVLLRPSRHEIMIRTRGT